MENTVHTLNPKIVFGLINLSEKEIKQCVTSLKARGKEYFSMDGSFLALTKSCAIDNPRQKDFDDLKYLFYKNEIDFDKLCCLFDKTYFLNNSRKIASENFKWFFSEEDEKFKSFLFGSFPNFVNLISNFENYYPSREFLLNFVKENSSKDRKSFSSVLYDLGLVFNKIDISEDEGKLKILASLLDSSKDLSHNEFNQLIQWKILPKFSKDKRKNKEILTCLI